MMDAALIEARGLDKSFGLTPVLRGVNLAVRAGGGAMIIGRNGSGKSTLIRILAGLSNPSAGEARLFSTPAHALGPRERRRVGLLTHQSFLYPNLTARENLEFYASLYRIPPAGREIDAWLARVGLAEYADERLRGFSRGMEQRLAIARAMLHRPDVLLMDEPFAALDPEGIAAVAGLLEEAARRGCAIVLSAHQASPLGRLEMALYELERGRLHDLRGAAPAHARTLGSEPPAAAG